MKEAYKMTELAEYKLLEYRQMELFVPYFCKQDNRLEYAVFRGAMDGREVGCGIIELFNDAHNNTVTEDTLHRERYMSRHDLLILLRNERHRQTKSMGALEHRI